MKLRVRRVNNTFTVSHGIEARRYERGKTDSQGRTLVGVGRNGKLYWQVKKGLLHDSETEEIVNMPLAQAYEIFDLYWAENKL